MRQAVLLVILLFLPLLARAEGETAGDFDYWVFSLSWSPSYCALEGRSRGSPQCETDAGWLLHGLWPQFDRGWPSYCHTPHGDPSRSETAAMADIMGSAGSAWHQWTKHGRCSGMAAQEYFALSRRVYEEVRRPGVFRRLDRALRLPADVVEEAFLAENPHLAAADLTVTCREGRIHEVRVCFDRDMRPRACGADVGRLCSLDDALLSPVR